MLSPDSPARGASGAFDRVRPVLTRLAAPIRKAWDEVMHPPAPSPRVAQAIADAESIAEILVGWVQVLGVVVFLVLYAASHGAFMTKGVLEPVPIALAAYGAFVCWRLRLAYAGALTRSWLAASAAVDVAVLMVLIYSFTLQYSAPPALYLKGPTLFYAFILIALRALRFDAAHVALTGVLVASGWVVLSWLAADGAPRAPDYPTYLTSLSILWGAEAEKIVAILSVTAVLSVAVSRARTLLVRTTVEETAARDLSRFLDAGAARLVRNSLAAPKAGDGALKPMAIMFLDLRGFSAASAMLAPADVIALLQDFQSRFVPIVEAAGGSVDKYLGDGILISFGGGERVGTEAADAFSAVDALVRADDDWAQERARRGLAPLSVAVAITHGDVVHGVIGHRDRLEYTVIGDAVNLAAKLEKHAKLERARVIATKAAHERALAQGAAIAIQRTAAQAAVEGAPEPVDLVIIA